jgi:hypothetical protein
MRLTSIVEITQEAAVKEIAQEMITTYPMELLAGICLQIGIKIPAETRIYAITKLSRWRRNFRKFDANSLWVIASSEVPDLRLQKLVKSHARYSPS